jgi:hypothetical protein
MALTANRIEMRRIAAAVAPDAWGQGLGDGLIEQHWYDHPYPHISILVFERKTYTDQFGNVIGIDSVTWDYDEVTRSARSRLHEIWAYVWLPGVTNTYALTKVQQERTIYYTIGWLIGGPCSEHTTKAGWVIYDLLPASKDLTPDQVAKVHVAGIATNSEGHNKYSSSTELHISTETGRMWETAKDTAAIVKKATAPQIALWRDPFEIHEQTVEEDFQKIVTTTYDKNLLQSGPPKVSRTEQLKDPYTINIPLDILPPEIAAADVGSLGVRIDLKGGGVDLANMDQWYVEHIEHIRPEKYGIYRKTTVQPASVPSGDPYGLMAVAPTYTPTTIGAHLQATVITDFGGTPTTDLPGIAAPAEPEDPTPPVADVWQRIDEVENLEKDPDRPGRALYFDATVETGGTYEYFATAILGTQESPESKHVTIAYGGSLGSTSGLVVKVIEHPDGSITIDASRPSSPDIPDGYGETVLMTVPAAPDSLDDAAALGKDIALRQFLRDSNQEVVSIPLAVTMFGLERGQKVALPLLSRELWGNGLHITSQFTSQDMILEGFGPIVIQRSGDAFTVDGGVLQLEAP